jgi:hypothetical protein
MTVFVDHVLDEEEVIELLRAAVDREGSQAEFARRHAIDRVHVNRKPASEEPRSCTKPN